MSTSFENPLVRTSVLDRVIADSGQVTTAEYRELIRRDLEFLLNTRCVAIAWDPAQEELDRSILSYGIPDIVGVEMGSSRRRDQLREIVQRTIRDLEPRLSSVRVELVGDPEPIDRVLRFRIEATLRIGRNREHVAYDTSVQPTSMTFDIQG